MRTALTEGLIPDSTVARYVALGLVVLTAAGVYATPNGGTAEPGAAVTA